MGTSAREQVCALRNMREVKTIAIVGTGVIGSGWAAIFAARGYAVKAYVRSAASEHKAKVAVADAYEKLIDRGIAKDPKGGEAVRYCRSLKECVSDADYVQESVIE